MKTFKEFLNEDKVNELSSGYLMHAADRAVAKGRRIQGNRFRQEANRRFAITLSSASNNRKTVTVAGWMKELGQKCARWLIKGYVLNPENPQDTKQYGVSLENIFELIDTPNNQPLSDDEKEELRKEVDNYMKQHNMKPKFEFDDEFLKQGLENPIVVSAKN